MNRREFIQLAGTGAMTLFLSGCGLGALTGEKGRKETKEFVPGSVSGGKNMNIVLITSSPHPKNESTSIYLADRFTEGAKSAGHNVFTFDAAHEETHPCQGCDKCGMDGPCVFKDAIENKLMPKMLAADLIVLTTPLYYFGMSAQLKIIACPGQGRKPGGPHAQRAVAKRSYPTSEVRGSSRECQAATVQEWPRGATQV